MGDCIIKLPAITHTEYNDYSQLISAIRPMFDLPDGTHFILDFSQIKWLDANLLAIIGASIEHRRFSCHISYVPDSISRKQADLWGRNGFGKYFNLKAKKRYDTTVDYRVFHANDAKKFGSYIDHQLLTKKDFPNLSPALNRKISNNMQEIFGNAPLHGECYSVISCGQYFHKSKKLTFTIVDCGNTIAENVVEYYIYLNQPAPEHNIQWATIENNSTKKIVNGKSGGMGLALLKEFISLNEGHIQICSGNEFWEYTANKEKCTHISSNFPGTIVSININMNDRKSYSLKNEMQDIDDLF